MRLAEKVFATGAAAMALALLASAAGAQQALPPASGVVCATMPAASLPVPPNGCIWAGRAFSNGAEFCFAPKVEVTCNDGKWAYGALPSCDSAAPLDTR